MKSNQISYKEANENLKWIFLVGLALGVANYALGTWSTLGQSIVQSIIISFVIGYTLFLVVVNLPQFIPSNYSALKKNMLFVLAFCIIGFIGSEIESIVRSFFFEQVEYQFLGHTSIYLFNAILTNVLGFGLYPKYIKKLPEEVTLIENTSSNVLPTSEILTTIPIKQGENINLHSLSSVIYFEAYDNYSFLFDLDGKKYLCNYSLLFLEKKLPQNFIRVHRKHLINKNQISQIKPHLKGRFVIVFKDKNQSSITSSNSYTEIIKSLIKL